MFLPLLTRLALWNYLPTGRSRLVLQRRGAASRANPARFWARLRTDLGSGARPCSRDGALTAQVAARMPLTEVTAAMELAESHTVVGKVILEPRLSPH